MPSSSLQSFYQLNTTEPSSEFATETVQITNGTVECICICHPQSYTLQETTDLRKKALSVDKEKLSSVLRKQISASDSRLSSTVVGSIGAAVICLVVGVIVLPDTISMIYFLYKILKNNNVHKERNTFDCEMKSV